MNKLLVLFFGLLLTNITFGQNSITGKLTALDTMRLEILSAYPDSFPNVLLTFKAEDISRRPIWDLNKSKIRITENSIESQIDSLYLLSKNQPINISVILDHSGSMQTSDELLDTIKYPEMSQYIFDGFLYYTADFEYPEGYIPPIEHAKSAVSLFTKSFNTDKDSISLIGFSSSIDFNFPFTNETSKMDSVLSLINANGMTAFYDALEQGITNLEKVNGQKSIVALTDGLNNNSKKTMKEVIELASLKKIPIYVVGLGSVNIDTLKIIAQSTNAQFYHTNDPSSLGEIYTVISKTIQSVYELSYTSNNLSHIDSLKTITLSYDIDSIQVQEAIIEQKLPKEVLIKLKERNKRQRQSYSYIGLIVLVTVTLSGVLYYKTKGRQQ